LKGVERVLLISSADRQMMETQRRFIDACKAAGVRHIVKISGKESGIGFDQQKFTFTRMHEEIERYLEGTGVGWTHLRPSQFMQVYLREAPTIIAEGAFYLPLDKAELAPVDLRDVAAISVALLRGSGHEGRSYDLTGPEALTMTDVADRISAAIGRPIRYVSISPEERRRNQLRAGLPAFVADALYEQSCERLRSPKAGLSLDTHKEFGVKPTTFAAFAKRYAGVFDTLPVPA
jgi:uncharacterized protein YbjT (DUF2867 family)